MSMTMSTTQLDAKALALHRVIAIATLIMASIVPAVAQDFPSKPIRIVTSTAGGGSDTVSRLLAQGMAAPLGQPIIVDNRRALLSIDAVSKSAPDGHTLLVAGSSLWINPLLEKLDYDPVRDFAPISLMSREVFIFAVHPSVPVKSVKELIALAKARPGQLNFGTTGFGGAGSLGVGLLKSMTGINIVHVPYRGASSAILGLISGEVHFMIADLNNGLPQVRAGKARALAVTTAEPSLLTPDLPTVASNGLPGFEVDGATAIWAPAKAPSRVVNRLNQEVVRHLNRPETKERFLQMYSEVVASSPEVLATTIKADTLKWSKVIKEAGIKAE